MSEEEHLDSEFYYRDEDHKVATNETTSGNTNEGEESNNQEELFNFVKEQKSKNTERTKTSGIHTFRRFLVDLPAHKLDRHLARFFKDVRRQNGDVEQIFHFFRFT